MTPPAQPSEHYADALSAVIGGLLAGDDDAVDAAYAQLTPPDEIVQARRPTMTVATKKLVFDRDRYQCRYCGRKVVLSDVAALLSVIDPKRFPWHRNWRAGSIHPAFPLIIASVDHIDPYAGGGSELPGNLATACWPCNAAKGDSAGWQTRDPDDADPTWHGLTDRYRELWIHADSPQNYQSSVNRWAI